MTHSTSPHTTTSPLTRFARTVVLGACLVAPTMASAGAPSGLSSGGIDDLNIDHAGLARTVLERAGLQDLPSEEVSVEVLMERSFFTLRLGLFDLSMSGHEFANKANGNRFSTLGVAMLDVQSAFLEWLGPKAPGAKDAAKDLKTLRKWVKGLRGDVIENLDASVPGDLVALLKAKSRVVDAQARFGTYMSSGAPLGLEREGELVDPFVVAPSRRSFLELLSAFGQISPGNRSIYWTDDVATWTNTYYNNVSVVALEFADLGSSTAGAFGGISMDSRTPTGTSQQIAQLAGNSLFDNLYGDKIPPSLAGALSVNLVIDVYGECNTRVDGDLRARRTEAREIFVPGGASEGGVLPPHLADSRWRGEHGKDHFLVALQQAQSAGDSGNKVSGTKNEVFELQDDAESKRIKLRSPFLGTPAADKEAVPDEFWGDSLEFYRSYRTGFVHWLQGNGKRSKKDSAKAFGQFLTALANEEGGVEVLESTIQEIYGVPLSAEETSKKDLEGRFLTWLAKL